MPRGTTAFSKERGIHEAVLEIYNSKYKLKKNFREKINFITG